MAGTQARPRISVIIPTYNRCDELRLSLEELTRQRMPAGEFEVVVADDGSSDATREVAESFAGRLRIVYHFQEDLGFRAGTARNGGARLASAPVLLFLDCGNLAGPDCLAAHLAAHEGEHVAAFGYVHGYNPEHPMPGLAEIMEEYPPERVYQRLRGNPAFLDIRVAPLAEYGGDLNRRPMPWQFFWSGNFSLRAEDFWALGGFDDDFRGWGGEDMEFGHRVQARGLPFRVVTGGWVLHAPHDRDMSANWDAFVRNIGMFLDKHREPSVELGTVLVPNWRYWEWAHRYRDLEAWRERARGLDDVSDEVAAALRGAGDGTVVVIGAGGRLPGSLPPSAVVADFDRELLDRALDGSGRTGYHALGVRLPLEDRSAGTVVITSRLAGLWEEWGEHILAEARRVGRTVRAYAPASWGSSAELLAAAGLEEDVSYYGEFTAPDERAVLTVPMRIQAAWASNDPQAFADTFAEQGSLLMQDTQLTSREQIRDYMTAGFSGPLRGARVKGWPLTVDFLTDDVAMAVTEGGIMMRGETAIAPERRIRATWVVVRQPDGALQLLSHHGSPIR